MGPTCRPICLLLTGIVGITNVQWQTLFYDFENYLISNAILLHKRNPLIITMKLAKFYF
jgi:hypothetical protein